MFDDLGSGSNIGIRPLRDSDEVWFERIYLQSRDDIRMADNDQDYIETVIDMQYRAKMAAYQQAFPNAWHMIVEVQGDPAGRLVLDFVQDEVRIVDLVFAQPFVGKGYGEEVIRGLKHIAEKQRVSLMVVVSDLRARLYQTFVKAGFQPESTIPGATMLSWRPGMSDSMSLGMTVGVAG